MATLGFTNGDQQMLLAPQINCELVYRFNVFKHPDGTTGSSERTATGYSAGTPAAALFDAPALKEASLQTRIEPHFQALREGPGVGWPNSSSSPASVPVTP
jgi:hypothetical protein